MKTVVFLSCLLFIALCSSTVIADEKRDPHMITVYGTGEVKVVPDEVVITLGHETSNKAVKDAIRANDEQIKKLLEVIKKSGVEQKYIQTTMVSVRPEYRDDRLIYQGKANANPNMPQMQTAPSQVQATTAENHIKFFTAQKTIVITVKDTSKVEELLSSLYETGVTQISGIDYRTTELRKHRDRAREMAMKAAREKAIAMAAAVDHKVGRVISINENSSGSYGLPIYNRSIQSPFESSPSNPAEESEGSIALGQISISANVTVQFELP
jgi:uncharacterized protein